MPISLGCLSATDLEPLSQQLDGIEQSIAELSATTPLRSELAAEHADLQQLAHDAAQQASKDATSLENLLTNVERLERELAVANARIDVLTGQISQATSELEEVRTAAVEAQRQVEVTVDGGEPVPSDPRQAYNQAYKSYVEGRYQQAVGSFEHFLDRYPSHELADNATYWLGECHYRRNDFRRAIARFDEVLSRYERSDRVASSKLKKAYALLELGQRADGIEQLKAVKCGYTGTDEAALADGRLTDLGVDEDC